MVKYRNIIAMLVAAMLLGVGCAHHRPVREDGAVSIYVPSSSADLLRRYAPRFVVYESDQATNRIGRPRARLDSQGKEEIYIDSDDPVLYYMIRDFEGQAGQYTNLIYRVHFAKIPFSLIPFHLTAGKNVGLLVVVTLDAAQRPVLVTTVHTCGCYMAIVPTKALPDKALPEKWKPGPKKVYGEVLPARLDFGAKADPVLFVHLRPQVHRVMDLEVADRSALQTMADSRLSQVALEPMENLKQIPLKEDSTSLYHDQGAMQGHVKGSIKGWETLLLSIISLDLYVGTDKAYADTQETGNPFYTSLKPWNRKASNMWYFARFLEFWGWRL